MKLNAIFKIVKNKKNKRREKMVLGRLCTMVLPNCGGRLATVLMLHGLFVSLTPTTVPELLLDCRLQLFTKEEGGSGGDWLDSWLLASDHSLCACKTQSKTGHARQPQICPLTLNLTCSIHALTSTHITPSLKATQQQPTQFPHRNTKSSGTEND